MVMFKSLEMIY